MRWKTLKKQSTKLGTVPYLCSVYYYMQIILMKTVEILLITLFTYQKLGLFQVKITLEFISL